MSKNHELTRLLQAWSEGDLDALGRLAPMVLQDLRRMAGYFFCGEGARSTIQPTVLVNELFIRLYGQRVMRWDNRNDFFSFAAEVMRHILVDHARGRKSQKRGGGIEVESLEALAEKGLIASGLVGDGFDFIDLHRALEDLARVDARQAKVVSLRFFVGLTVAEVAEALGFSEATVKREWRTAKLWLHRRLLGTRSD